ncbi:MAG: hypothetical protein AAF411_05670 [Myxococcota bacterium]
MPLLLALMGACGGEASQEPVPEPEAQTPRRHGGGAARRHAGEGGRHARASAPEPLARRSPGREPLEPRTSLEGPMVLNFRDGARVELLEGALAVLLDEAPAQLVLARGAAHAILPPIGNSTRPPLRVASPAGTLTIDGSADAWLLVRTADVSWYALARGQGVVREGTEAERVSLHAGQSYVSGSEGPVGGPEDERTARAILAELAQSSAPSAEPAPLALADSLARARASWARGEALQRAFRESEGDAKRAALRELSAFGQETQRLRDRLLLSYERAVGRALLQGDEPTLSARGDVRDALRLD